MRRLRSASYAWLLLAVCLLGVSHAPAQETEGDDSTNPASESQEDSAVAEDDKDGGSGKPETTDEPDDEESDSTGGTSEGDSASTQEDPVVPSDSAASGDRDEGSTEPQPGENGDGSEDTGGSVQSADDATETTEESTGEPQNPDSQQPLDSTGATENEDISVAEKCKLEKPIEDFAFSAGTFPEKVPRWLRNHNLYDLDRIYQVIEDCGKKGSIIPSQGRASVGLDTEPALQWLSDAGSAIKDNSARRQTVRRHCDSVTEVVKAEPVNDDHWPGDSICPECGTAMNAWTSVVEMCQSLSRLKVENLGDALDFRRSLSNTLPRFCEEREIILEMSFRAIDAETRYYSWTRLREQFEETRRALKFIGVCD